MSSAAPNFRSRMLARLSAGRTAASRPARDTVPQPQRTYGPPPAIGARLEVRVVGVPRGQPRPKGRIVQPRGKPPFIQFYDPHDADDWKAAVKRAFRVYAGRPLIEGPVSCSIDFLLPRPKYLITPWFIQHAAGELPACCKPDRDNAEKAVLDALTDACLWKDDAQVCAGAVRKFYHAIGDQPGARITVEVLPPVPMPPKRQRPTESDATLFAHEDTQ